MCVCFLYSSLYLSFLVFLNIILEALNQWPSIMPTVCPCISLSLSLSLFNIFLKRSKMEKEKNFSFVPYFCVTLIMNNLREGRRDLRSYNNQLQTSLVKCLKLIWIIHLMTKISVASCSLIYLFFTFSCAWYVISGYGKERERQERASI